MYMLCASMCFNVYVYTKREYGYDPGYENISGENKPYYKSKFSNSYQNVNAHINPNPDLNINLNIKHLFIIVYTICSSLYTQ